MSQARRATPDLEALVDLYYEKPAELGEFQEVEEGEVPQPFRRLLAHDQHMTVTVEAHHGCLVDVCALEVKETATHYSRKIVLNRQRDGRVVQFGIVRLNLDYLGEDVRRVITRRQTPLGRILIMHNVLRTVRLLSLWRIEPGPDLRECFSLPAPRECYGRTALIYCNGVPAVELLEIVPPDAQ